MNKYISNHKSKDKTTKAQAYYIPSGNGVLLLPDGDRPGAGLAQAGL